MTEYRNYTYNSVLAPYIRDFIFEKRSLGFIYNAQAYQLKRFDIYWCNHGYDQLCMTRRMLEEWLCCLPNESKSNQSGRIGTVKSLSIYMNTLGIKCYIPFVSIGKDHNTIHVLSALEIQELYKEIDSYVPASINPADYRMANEYPVMFRLYYCCGMRNNEVCVLETSDVDLESGILIQRAGATNGKKQAVKFKRTKILIH